MFDTIVTIPIDIFVILSILGWASGYLMHQSRAVESIRENNDKWLKKLRKISMGFAATMSTLIFLGWMVISFQLIFESGQ